MKLPSHVQVDHQHLISVIACCYNEAHVLPEFHHRLMLVLSALPVVYEVLYVHDGSHDGSYELLEQFCRAPPGCVA
ncbi:MULTISPECIES: glycosyltransferase [unclassified Pseudomonas]|uniref:glycosyltransferase n=1 Tax=unclassified Pseudomonas TaxID=196821 RepID=UPI000A1F0677|nr:MULTISPECIES: glycosyltransferase [unclassified Pseudomonas]